MPLMNWNFNYKFLLKKGNNDELIRKIFLSRPWFQETDDELHFNVLWQQWTPKETFYYSLQRDTIIANHLPGNRQLHSKILFYQNILLTYRNKSFKYVMPTYEYFGSQKQMFIQHFQWLEEQKQTEDFSLEELTSQNQMKLPNIPQKNIQQPSIKISSGMVLKKPKSQCVEERPRPLPTIYTKATPFSINKHNIWILKPEGMNRGRGITVINKIEQVQEHILSCKQNSPQKLFEKQSKKQEELNNSQKILKISQTQTSQSFLIQKYIENPFLYDNRKFDIRCFMLVKANGDVFIYNTGYLRLSSTKFECSSDDLTAHLTNNAVQKLLSCYQDFEEGNMKTFEDLDKIIQDAQSDGQKRKYTNFTQEIWPLMQQCMADIALRIGPSLLSDFTCKNCFELFGFDFMLTDDLQFKLIECNANPCLELSCAISWYILPSMIDQMFRLTIDETFHPPPNYASMNNRIILKSTAASRADNQNIEKQYILQERTLEEWTKIPQDQRQVDQTYWGCVTQHKKLQRQNCWVQYGRQWAPIQPLKVVE